MDIWTLNFQQSGETFLGETVYGGELMWTELRQTGNSSDSSEMKWN